MTRDDLLRAAEKLAAEFFRHPEVEGVCLLSSLATDDADEHSDIDLALFLTLGHPPELLRRPRPEYLRSIQRWIPAWLPSYRHAVRMPSGADVPVDLFQYSLDYEECDPAPWPLDQIEVYRRTCVVLHDRSGRVARLIRERTSDRTLLTRQRTELLAVIPLRLGKQVERALARGRPEDVDLLLRCAAVDMLRLAYLVDDQEPPTNKWALRLLARHHPDLAAEIHACLSVALLSDADRMTVRDRLLDVYAKLCGDRWSQADAYRQWRGPLESGRQLRIEASLDATEVRE